MKLNIITVILDGENFSDLQSFYEEVDRVLTKGLNSKTGHNLDAFNDILRGSFGVFDHTETLRLIWTNFSKSKIDLGDDLIAKLTEIIQDHDHIEFETTE